MLADEPLLMKAVICVVLVSAIGCADEKQTGAVVGAVQYRGSVVSEGIVTLYSPEMGLAKQSSIDVDGRFVIDGVRYGAYRVMVQPPMIAEDYGGKSLPGLVVKNVSNIPAKYRDFSTSGFSCDVKGRRTELELHME